MIICDINKKQQISIMKTHDKKNKNLALAIYVVLTIATSTAFVLVTIFNHH